MDGKRLEAQEVELFETYTVEELTERREMFGGDFFSWLWYWSESIWYSSSVS